MNTNTSHSNVNRNGVFRHTILPSLLIWLTIIACKQETPIPTETSLPTSVIISEPTIVVSGGQCIGTMGNKMPLSVTGIPGNDIVYRWTVSSGRIEPSEGPVVNYIPDEPGNIIIRVEAEKDGVISNTTISCTITGPTSTPTVITTSTPTLTPIPSTTPIPSPTPWECTSFRNQKIQSADIPGQVTIDTPAQGTIDLPSGREVRVAGSYTGIPEGKYLWVFIYSAQAGLHGRYYPQTRDAVRSWQPEPTTGQDGRWSLIINFGAPHLCYEIIVMLADASASQSITDQLKKWADLNNYTGYELNAPEIAVPPDAPGFPQGLVEKASIEVKTR